MDDYVAKTAPTLQETRARRCTMNRVLADALERLRLTGPEAADGAPNHGPMAAEALVALGYDDEVPQWVDAYRRQLGPMPETRLPVTTQTWRDALGSQDRVGDWVGFFRLQLSAAPWPAVLTTWLPQLLPGTMAHGTHGLIRTAHAVRTLEEAETPLRVEEFAVALGYWAAYYQALPGVPHLTGTCAIDQALDQLPRIGWDYDWRVTPRAFVRVLDTHPDFPKAMVLGAVRAFTALGKSGCVSSTRTNARGVTRQS